MIAVRGGSGLGDAIYVQGVVRHLVEGLVEHVEVCTAWPDVFRPLNGRVSLSPFRRRPIDRVAHYTTRRGILGTSQFQDCCITARVPKGIDFRLDWSPVNADPVQRLRSAGKPLIVVQAPRAPFGRSDGYGLELLPDCRTIQRVIDRLAGHALLIQVGSGVPLYRFSGIDVDLIDKTSVSELLDVAWACDGFLGYCSFVVPLAEALGKPALLVWSRAGLSSPHELVRQITPTKILHRPDLARAVMDDGGDAELERAVDAFLEQAGRSAGL